MDIQVVSKKSIYGYNPTNSDFYQVTLYSQRFMYQCCEILGRGHVVKTFASPEDVLQTEPFAPTFEGTVDPVTRLMVDSEIRGMNWVTAPSGCHTQITRPITFCQYEAVIRWGDLQAHNGTEPQYMRSAPLRILSFDIETLGRKGIFPDPDFDPIIQISAQLMEYGSHPDTSSKIMFCLKDTDALPGTDMRIYDHGSLADSERAMLGDFATFVQQCDPDSITGYNIENFDLQYVVRRALNLKSHVGQILGRFRNEPSKPVERTMTSGAWGTQKASTVNLPGRIKFDMLAVIVRDYKLSSYTLNSVSSEFLQERKEDVHYTEIPKLFETSTASRGRLAKYCMKDAALPLRLMTKLNSFLNYIEMARVSSINMEWLLSRGQSIKVYSQILRKTRSNGMLVPDKDKTGSDDGEFEGAIVIEPKRGYYDMPITVLDFQSLYPSIMIAHNLCYSTLLTEAQVKALGWTEGVEYQRTPIGAYFVMSHVKQGILTEILNELLRARSAAKKDMTAATDPFVAAVLDGRQLALKITANSVYGFTGATVGKLPCLQISSSVTSFGRLMIEKTKEVVEKTYCKLAGFAHDAVVIYGDTDSVMIKFGVKTVEEAFELGRQAAELVTREFVRPINLLFEKVYFPYLLNNKKRYAGYKWLSVAGPPVTDVKGLEYVRRDNCPMLRQVQKTAVEHILSMNPALAIEECRSATRRLMTNQVNIGDLIISKGYKKTDYKVVPIHVKLAAKMAKRDAGSAPKVGQRIPYVVITDGKKPVSERGEDPRFAMQHGLQLDMNYYLEHQLKIPMKRILEAIYMSYPDLFGSKRTTQTGIAGFFKKSFDKCHDCGVPFTPTRTVDKCETCLLKLQERDRKKALDSVFANVYVSAARKASVVTTAYDSFAIIHPCLRCRCKIPPNQMWCSDCMPYKDEAIDQVKKETEVAVEEHNKYWSECIQCQETREGAELCSNQDCDLFFRREKATLDMKQITQTLERIKLSEANS
eukprot:TRINITY_DN7638_c0_g1_i1.p1 TRINITY_DN7638_c0_g1~~TRINITY_DN7638_c0_g1_i1.p1  ORF type:complete len:1087 (-),score=146.10 TRINITY_DN7638_c0_g1_i1:5716-8670(-)